MPTDRPPLPPGPWLVVGLRRSGAAAARALAARGESVVCVDAGDPPEAAELREEGLEVVTATDGLAELAAAAAVVKSPGVPREAPVIVRARDAGLPVLGEVELGWRLLAHHPFVAVTGTNGKTTTVTLLGEIWAAAGRPVRVAGNVGLAVSGLVAQLDPATSTTIVCEVSSFQLEDVVAFAPEVGVLLNVAPDHLDRHGTLADYTSAKLRLFAGQGPGDVAVGPGALLTAAGGAARRVTFGDGAGDDLALREHALWWRGERLLDVREIRMRGPHNLENAMAAAAAALCSGIAPGAVREALSSFAGVEHRLEDAGTIGGVAYVNDSKATNVSSAIVALEAFDTPVHLILGGLGKSQDFAGLRDPAARHARAAYLIGEDAPVIRAALEGALELHDCVDLERAVGAAHAAARPGEVVLLSPACASFDQYESYEVRGAHFKALVGALRG